MSRDTQGGKRVVLVVDDDAAIRRVVRTVLEADGFEVLEAADGSAALVLLDSLAGGAPDAVILDVMMPGMDGIEVCRRIDHARVRVVLMLSARDDADTKAQAEAAGADGYLTKPFSAVELLDTLEVLAS